MKKTKLSDYITKENWNGADIMAVSDTMIAQIGNGEFIKEFLMSIPREDYVKYLKIMISQNDRAQLHVVG